MTTKKKAKKGTAVRSLDSALAKREGGKSQAKIGDVRQIRAEFEKIVAEETIARLKAQGYTVASSGTIMIEIKNTTTMLEFMTRVRDRVQAELKKTQS